MSFTFPRSEHLKSRKVIDRLFARPRPARAEDTAPLAPRSGTLPIRTASDNQPLTVYAYPFRVVFFRQNEASTEAITMPQVMVSVPKRTFKKAVDRNAVRRRVQEAYRLHKHRLTGLPPGTSPVSHMALLYTAKTKISFEDVEKGMKLAFKRMNVGYVVV